MRYFDCIYKIGAVLFLLAIHLSVEGQNKRNKNYIPQHLLTDSNATKATVNLYKNLKVISGKYTLFGQQDYGLVGKGWKYAEGRCDAKEVTGSYPALYSFDFMSFTNGPGFSKEGNDFLLKLMHRTFQRGGIISFCWHYQNPVTNGSFYDTTIAVKHILPGGNFNDKFKSHLKIIADIANNARDTNGILIPIIFRPWHEFDGQWFWWGKPHCTTEEFKTLYRYTVTYLRDSLHVHNFIYAFSPDCRFLTEKEYLERYPGDEFVDVIGMDNYWDFNPKGGGMKAVIEKTKIISDYAKKSGKIAALTETGLANLPDTSWYTQKLLKVIKHKGIKLAYAAVWRGEYMPYPGHPAAIDFINFRNDPKILFENDLPDMYSDKELVVRKKNGKKH